MVLRSPSKTSIMLKSTDKHQKAKPDENLGPITLQPNDLDMDFIESHSDSEKYEIPHYFDYKPWKTFETYRMRVSHIYDPSKFWIVVKDRELDYFQTYMYNFYAKHKEKLRIPSEKRRLKMYCAVNADQSFYRGILVNIPVPLCGVVLAYVFLIDWGCICKVPLSDLYYLPKSMFSVPRFAVRASLEGLASYDMKPWSLEAVSRFSELVTGKILLAIIMHIDESRKVLNINIGDVSAKSGAKEIIDVSEVLIREKIAKVLTLADIKDNKQVLYSGKFICNMKYPYLFPSFDSIENHETPDTVLLAQILKDHLPLDYQFKTLYSYKNIDVGT